MASAHAGAVRRVGAVATCWSTGSPSSETCRRCGRRNNRSPRDRAAFGFAGGHPGVAGLEDLAQDLLFRSLSRSMSSSKRLPGSAAMRTLPISSAHAARAKAVRVARGGACHRCQNGRAPPRRARARNGGLLASFADFAFDVVELSLPSARRVKFEDCGTLTRDGRRARRRARGRCRERGAVCARAFFGAGRRGDEVAAELAPMLLAIVQSQRVTSLQKRLRRERLGDEYRAAVDQRRAERRDAADAVGKAAGGGCSSGRSAPMSARPANQWLQATTRWWPAAAAWADRSCRK